MNAVALKVKLQVVKCFQNVKGLSEVSRGTAGLEGSELRSGTAPDHMSGESRVSLDPK